MKALSKLRILDLTHMLSGPYATQLLADLGAEVIKIEPPLVGEGTRRLLENDPDHSIDGVGAYFLTLGRNKKSVTLDLKSKQGKLLFYELVKKADVVVYNFRVGVAEKLEINHGKLMEINPQIVTCSISGFGETGPAKNQVSFDLVAQATGGGMSITGLEGDPIRAGIPIGDLGGGLMAAIGILAAINSRHSSGTGQHIDISMQDAQVSMLNYMATMTMLSGKQPPAIGNGHFVHIPYDAYPTATDHIIIAIITDPLWKNLVSIEELKELDLPEFTTQPGRAKNKAWIEEKLVTCLKDQPRSYWLGKMRECSVPCAPVNSIHDVLADPQILARQMIVDVIQPDGQSCRQPGNPIKLSESEETFNPAPTLGQHNQEVLSELLGLDHAELEKYRKDGVV